MKMFIKKRFLVNLTETDGKIVKTIVISPDMESARRAVLEIRSRVKKINSIKEISEINENPIIW